MEWLIFGGIAVAVVALGVLAQRKGWIDLTTSGARRRGGNHGIPLGVADEIFQPTRYETQLEQDRQAVLPAPAPIPGDKDRDDIYKGVVKIDVPGD